MKLPTKDSLVRESLDPSNLLINQKSNANFKKIKIKITLYNLPITIQHKT